MENFIEEAVRIASENGQKIITRYPPEPNGYAHIGHAKAFSISAGVTAAYNGYTNLRFDDTNPAKESMHYVDNLIKDIKWLGLPFKQVLFASDYYEKLYEFAVHLINKGLAYVDDQTADEISEGRGTLETPGKNSPYRERTIAENLDLFKRMRAGKFTDGAKVLRAKIDMSAPNMNMRDPVIYRIARVPHYRTGDDWLIYPMYDFAHPLSDYIEHISHSLCSLEFEDHRPIYNWFIEKCAGAIPDLPKIFPKQYEFSRLNIDRFVMSKRWLKRFVDEGLVDGWDDPRMPTISGMRRRGYTPESIREFVKSTGVSKNSMCVPISALEFYVRTSLDAIATRVHVVSNPIKVVITNYEGDGETLEIQNNPHDEGAGKHKISFSREVYIDGDDFSDNPPPKYKRLVVGGTVRLRGAYIIKCNKNCGTHLECEYIKESKSGSDTSGIKPAGVIHFVDAKTAVRGKIREFEPLLIEGTALNEENINKNTMRVIDCVCETYLKDSKLDEKYQFVRKGFYVLDEKADGELLFNKTVGLKEGF
ncbi:MAG: glutamine--tRNA ligase [Christensenellaceae bacterium]|nr:glutamine--tRNA ligase [Christensenellaceae bacterium]